MKTNSVHINLYFVERLNQQSTNGGETQLGKPHHLDMASTIVALRQPRPNQQCQPCYQQKTTSTWRISRTCYLHNITLLRYFEDQFLYRAGINDSLFSLGRHRSLYWEDDIDHMSKSDKQLS